MKAKGLVYKNKDGNRPSKLQCMPMEVISIPSGLFQDPTDFAPYLSSLKKFQMLLLHCYRSLEYPSCIPCGG